MIICGVIFNNPLQNYLLRVLFLVLVTIALMTMNRYVAKNVVIQEHLKRPFEQRCQAFKKAIWAVLTPILIIGGIFSLAYQQKPWRLQPSIPLLSDVWFTERFYKCCSKAVLSNGDYRATSINGDDGHFLW